MTSIGAWLQASGLERRDAEALLSEALGLSRAQILAHPEAVIPSAQYAVIRAQAARVRNGIPVPYVLGFWEFWGLQLVLSPNTLIPRPDTERLVELVLETAPSNATVLELGTGSGAIAIALKKERDDLSVTATDISLDALAIARQNAARHEADIEFIHTCWFQDISSQYDLIVSNPPYIAANDPHLAALHHEPQSALVAGPEGLDDLRHIVRRSIRHLRPTGSLLVEHGYEQGEAVRKLFVEAGFADVATHRDLGDNERVTLGRMPHE